MKRVICIFLSLTVLLACLTGCGNIELQKTGPDKIKVVTISFPEYDWVRNLTAGTNNIETVMLNRGGIDLHSFQPSANDLIEISSCDVLVYTGGESEGWITDSLSNAVNKNMKVVNLLECIGNRAFEEETVEGMEAEDEEEGEEIEFDEHVWLSVKNADIVCGKICDILAQCDESEAQTIRKNYSDYSQSLKALDELFVNAVADGQKDTIVFGDRFPYRYLVEDYGLKYYAAFPGCSAESEASFETILFLGQKMDDLGLEVILKIDGSDETICRTVLENSQRPERKILTMNSMQSIPFEQADRGTTYIQVMNENLSVLKEALK